MIGVSSAFVRYCVRCEGHYEGQQSQSTKPKWLIPTVGNFVLARRYSDSSRKAKGGTVHVHVRIYVYVRVKEKVK